MAGSASLLWVAAGLIGLVTVAPEIDRAVSIGSAAEVPDGFSIPRARDGQFYIDGKIGEVSVRFLVDPGADGILIAGADAERLGIAGEAELARLDVGPHQLRHVPAEVAPAIPVSLLGRAFLSRFPAIDLRGDRMVLR